MTSKRADELLKADEELILHPAWPIGSEAAGLVFEKANGVILQDVDGKEYIDISGQLMNVNLGHGRREIIDAIVKQANELQYTDAFRGKSSRATIECAQNLARISPAGLNHFLFAGGGSEANEYAFELSRLYWRRQQKANKFKIISLRHSYHGISFAAATASGIGRGNITAGFEPSVPGFLRIPSYYCYRCDFGLEYPGCGMHCAKYLETTIEDQGSGSVAAFIAEGMHGAGGVIPPPPEWWPFIREICTKHDVLLIDDEVMSGFCRTGKMFAVENWGVVPDIMTMSKGINSAYLPFGAVAINDMVFEGLKGSIFIGFSSCGNPICSAAASAAMGVYVKERIAEHVAKVGEHVKKRLDTEFGPLPYVGDIRGLGLFIGIELVADKATKAKFDPALNVPHKLNTQLREKGVVARTDDAMIVVAPPLIISEEEVDRALDVMYPVLADFKPG